jgi:hypothetical protein
MHATELPWIKILLKTKVKPKALDQYYGEITSLGNQLYEILDRGKKWSGELVSAFNSGGAAIFPHTYFSKCGDQMGAVIHAILDSGADQVLLLGTAHAFPRLFDGRVKEFNKEDITNESSWGILDPATEKGKHLLEHEFSLNLFKSLWRIEVERRGIKGPQLIERYPNLVNRHPEALPGMQELKEIAKNAVIVGTEDYCHHGIAYAVPKESALPMSEKALSFARKQIEEGYSFLEKDNYAGFYMHGMHLQALGDPTDVTATLHYLVGSHAKPKILDLKLVDVAPLFEGDPSPSWVAATLAKITPA